LPYRLLYPVLTAGLAVFVGLCGEASGATTGGAYPVTLLFSAGNAQAHLQRGLTAVIFEAVKHGTRNPTIPLQSELGFAAVALQLRLSCDLRLEANGELTNYYWVQRGHEGTEGISVHHNSFSYKRISYDGCVHEGNITFQAKFARGGTIAEGSVRVGETEWRMDSANRSPTPTQSLGKRARQEANHSSGGSSGPYIS
jgi:hypothetical protein